MIYHPLHEVTTHEILREFASTDNPDIEFLCDRLSEMHERVIEAERLLEMEMPPVSDVEMFLDSAPTD